MPQMRTACERQNEGELIILWIMCNECSWFRWMDLTPRVADAGDIHQVLQKMKSDHAWQAHGGVVAEGQYAN